MRDLLTRLGIPKTHGRKAVRSPIDGCVIGKIDTSQDVNHAVDAALTAFLAWRRIPPPRRGELIRQFGEELRAAKDDLGLLVTLETGKILQEGQGEVQEMIDICDFAVGLSRQLYGLTMATERSEHRMMETWHPLGPVAIITAFNFPVAVWAWNAALALVCGNSVVWKPSEKTPLCALAVQSLFQRAVNRCTGIPEGLSQLILGGKAQAKALADHKDVKLLSATGSTAMGKALAPRVATRLGRSLLELGGNNAAVVCASANLDLAVRAIVFAAVGTAGQRCTSLRRLFVHTSILADLTGRLKAAFATLRIGDPRQPETLVGPLIDVAAFTAMQTALIEAKAAGGRIHGGERVDVNNWTRGYYVRPALVEMNSQTEIMGRETFAPILYVTGFETLDQAIALNNEVNQGLASSIFTRDLREAETFLSAWGSDCGIVNVNIGPSGAEIGGAFGGEKDTGGGRESGSDSWKAYMRRSTNTINFGCDLPLAQGIKFDLI